MVLLCDFCYSFCYFICERNIHKHTLREKIIFSRLIDYSHLAMLRFFFIWKYLVQLSLFQRHFIAVVFYTDYEFMHINLTIPDSA